MKKRILSLFLACVLLLSAVPVISDQNVVRAAENVTQISDYDQFVKFLESTKNSDKTEAVLVSDITADGVPVGGYDVNNMHLDGNGYSITGLKVEDSLFGTFTNSSVRNLTFKDAVVENTSTEEASDIALIAQKITDNTSNITNCVFDSCTLILPETGAYAAFVTVYNNGFITNCKITENSLIKCKSESSNIYKAGGIAYSNSSGSYIINCESRVQFDLKSSNISVAGISVTNSGRIDLCYANCQSTGYNPVAAESKSINNSVYRKADGSYYMGSKSYTEDKLDVLAADMSQNVMNFISNPKTPAPIAQADYPVLWSIESGEPSLSYDLRTAQVYLMVDANMNDAELEFSLGAQEIQSSSGRRYSVAVGKFSNGSYVRNKLTITLELEGSEHKMVNSFVYKPAFTFMNNLNNPFENQNYSQQFIKAEHQNKSNIASFELLPYCWNLSLTNVHTNDEIVDYRFEGDGTEENPFKIQSGYELGVLSDYVAGLKTYETIDKSGKEETRNYNKAHYLLTTDLSDISIFPIGLYGGNVAFKGTFDGGAHIIRNLRVSYNLNDTDKKETNSYLGMFGCVEGTETEPAVIKNLNIINADISTEGDLCGIVVGQADHAVINGCVTSGVVSGGTQISGVVGYAHNSKIYNCGSTATIITANPNASAGGVVGYCENSNVRNSYYSGSIVNENVVKEKFIVTGGVTGYLENTELNHCFYNVDNNGSRVLFDSGIKGVNETAVSTIQSDSFLNDLKEYSSRAGFDTLWGKDEKSVNSGFPVIVNPQVSGLKIICISTEAGYVTSNVSEAEAGDIITLTVVSDNELRKIHITNMDREEVDINCSPNANGTYSFVMPSYSVRVVPEFNAEAHLSGRGTFDDPYIVSNYAELELVSDKCNHGKKPRNQDCVDYKYAYYELAKDIDGEGKKHKPFGITTYYSFCGHFDGRGHTISNLTLDSTTYNSIFGYCSDAEIHDVVFENINVTGSSSAIVTAAAWGDTFIYNVTLRNCTVKKGNYLSGFVGLGENIRIVNCVADNIRFDEVNNSSLLIYSVLEGIYFDNLLIMNSEGYLKLLFSSNAIISESDHSNIYCCNSDFSKESYLNDSIVQIDPSKLSDKDFVAGLSENAYNINRTIQFNSLDFWGLDAKTELAYENGVTGILPVHYAKEFDDKLAVEVFVERVTASEIGSVVEIPCNDTVDFSRIKLTTPSGMSVGYCFKTNSDGKYILTFMMPEEPVVISNSGVVPNVEAIPGTGTKEDPYRISIPQHIMLISDVTNGRKLQYKDIPEDVDYIKACFVLENDIDMSAYNWILPVGNSDEPFTGVFDGKNFAIKNLKSTFTTAESFGLFGTAKGAKLMNIKLDGINYYFDGDKDMDIGGLCGNVLGNGGAVIMNCYVYGSINVSYCDSLGGICGEFWNDNAGIECCITKCEILVRTQGDSIGGIVGMTKSDIRNCAVQGPVLAVAYDCGGISGGDASNVYRIENCYFSGGMAGSFTRSGEISTNAEVCYNCFYLEGSYLVSEGVHTTVAGISPLEKFVSGEITYLLNQGLTDGTQVWYQNVDNGLPPEDFPHFLKHATNTVYQVNRADAGYSNLNFKDGVYEIGCPEELMAFSYYVNNVNCSADAVVVADIDMTGYDYTPIGQTKLYYKSNPTTGEKKGFCGNFDGQGYVISNLTVKGSSSEDLSYGLFGTVTGEVKNIGVENFKYTSDGKDCRVGAVAGQIIEAGTVTDCYAKNVDINTKVNTTNGVAGGIAGANYAGKVSNCYTYNVSITAGRSGGIVADNFGDGNNSDGTDRPGVVTNCYTNYSNICGRGTAEGGLSSVSEYVFKSGEIVYKLSNGREDALWRRGMDGLPAFKGDVIYQNICKDEYFYDTFEADFDNHVINHKNEEVRCKRCKHFDSATLITESNYADFGLNESYVGMYAIENTSNLYWLNEKDRTEDIKTGMVLLTDITIDSFAEEWKPMNVDDINYKFVFDGNGHTLTLKLDFGSEQRSENLALFGNFNYAEIKNLTLKGSVTANTTGNMGGLAASVYRSTFEKVISYADVINSCTTGGQVGGLAGYYGGQMDSSRGHYSRILNCAVYADVKGYEAGGVVGHGWNGKQYYDIRNCAFVGDVTGVSYSGAIIGYHGNNQDAHSCTFKDIYYLEKDGLGFVGGGNTNYTLDTTVCEKSQAQFESGEVAYLLNNGKTDSGIWKQDIDLGETKDLLPLHKGGIVYKNTTCIDEFIEYTNTKDEDVHDYNNYYVCKKCIGLYPGKIAGVYGFDIGLSGSIELNYYMVIDEEAAKDPTARMVFTVPNGSKSNPDDTYEVEVPLSEAEFDGTFYYFSCGIPAKEMCSDILCKLVTDTQESDTFRYSVKEYAEYILANPEGNEDAIPLIKSILNYGAYTQIDLSYKTNALANDSVYMTDEDKQLPDVNLREYDRFVIGEQKGVSYYGSSLTLLSDTTINLYYYFDNPEDIETLDITVNGEKVVPVKNNSYYKISIKGTVAQDYHLYHVIKIGDMTTYYCVFSYGAVVQKDNDDPEALDASKSMYVYNREILKYLELNNK